MSPMTFHLRSSALLITVLASTSGAALPGQNRDIVQLTKKQEVHQNARISPDGTLVAFKGPGKIGLVPAAGGAEATLLASNNLGDFLWGAKSTGLYYTENDEVRFIARTGGRPRVLAKLANQQHRVWSVDATDKTMFGTSLDPIKRDYVIWLLDTSGNQKPVEVTRSQFVLDEVRVDPGGRWLVYRSYPSGPFTQREFFRIDLNGKNKTSLGKPPLNANAGGAHWVDAGSTVVFQLVSAKSNVFHLGRLSTASSMVEMLSENSFQRQKPVVGPGQTWIVAQTQYAGGVAPGVMPVAGGAAISLGHDKKIYLFQGEATIDQAGKRVVFAATIAGKGGLAQVYKAELDRELVVAPRAEVGKTFRVELPMNTGELGAVVLGLRPAGQLVSIGGIRYGLALDPSLMVVLASGGSTKGALTVPVPVPNNPWFKHQELLFQGVRLQGSQGDFTRHGRLVIF